MNHCLQNPARLTSGRLACALGLCAAAWAGTCLAVTHLQRGSSLPALSLKDISGEAIGNATFRGHVVVLVFGEAHHEKTREAWATIRAVLADQRFARESVLPVLVVAEDIQPEDLRFLREARVAPTILRDPRREAFAAFRVTAMPSIVVVGRDGRVVHAIAGLIPRLDDILADSLLYACGMLTGEHLDRTLHPGPTTRPSDAAVRAERIAQLATQLARRGMADLALEKYREALALDARHPGAQLGLARLLLGQRQLVAAEFAFRNVLAEHPESTQALLGLSYVQMLRGGPELEEAEKNVRGVLARSPALPRAHYLMGRIHEQRSRPVDAAASFRRASELLLEDTE